MMQLLAAIVCLTLAFTATSSAAAPTSSESNVGREMLLPQMVVASDGSDGEYPVLSELSLSSGQADRIRSAMARFLAQRQNSAEPRYGQYVDPIRLRTRSASSPTIDNDVFIQLLSTLEAEHEKEQRSVHQQHQQQAQQQSSSGGYKSLRNIQPVYMRLPPRFGKRSTS